MSLFCDRDKHMNDFLRTGSGIYSDYSPYQEPLPKASPNPVYYGNKLVPPALGASYALWVMSASVICFGGIMHNGYCVEKLPIQ